MYLYLYIYLCLIYICLIYITYVLNILTFFLIYFTFFTLKYFFFVSLFQFPTAFAPSNFVFLLRLSFDFKTFRLFNKPILFSSWDVSKVLPAKSLDK